ncbi:TIR domain-containing protein [Sphingosinicella humi]|uniref:ATPase n=1 Tax=Allosphingosinicella humi TaxID=2068657 RepID=A0A2U2J4S7_9SPHN|nr:TIR domain-containing protein [Sphingosinicella humi]PWG03312.1 ATPase [Sphingosinicella humi]
MPEPKVEEVFKRSGIPTFTFVEPREYDHLRVAIRTPGRGVVVEGPSGIGKTTAVLSVIEQIGLQGKAQKLSARRREDRDVISLIPEVKGAGLVVIDDFHRLEDGVKHAIADFMKDLADREDDSTKIVLIGINKAGNSLVHFAPDLNNRIDTIRFEVNSNEKVCELIAKGEQALNVRIAAKEEIAADAAGSFHLAQLLCHDICLLAGVTERSDAGSEISNSLEAVKGRVLDELARTFSNRAMKFARGRRFRRVGRAPYLLLLKWLSDSDEGALSIDQALMAHSESRGSVGQIVDKGWLSDFLREEEDLQELLHFDSYTRQLAIEDPKFIYFIRNILWSKFVKEAGFLTIEFRSRYDFAFSFAGEDRSIVEKLRDILQENEVEVFYDKDEQHRILASDVEDYLAPIYRSEARFVVAFLSNHYPKKIWTKFESQQFKERFGEGSIIPIWFSDATPGMFDESTRYGGLGLDVEGDFEEQANVIASVLLLKLAEERQAEEAAEKEAEEPAVDETAAVGK